MAMAFDHEDTDALYLAVKKALSQRITVVRIDRIEHNDDIDKRIISEIERADFVIADLTYARPSVYFEAGYAQRKVPVVYTARSDHFRDKLDDSHGNLRVHFDLQMKNIIAWASPTDSAFLTRLTTRIGKVVAPLVSLKLADDSQKKNIASFDRLSIQDKRAQLISAATKHFQNLKFKVIPLTSDETTQSFPYTSTATTFWGGIAAIKRTPSEFRFVLVHTTTGITKQLCESYQMLSRRPFYKEMFFEKPSTHILDDTVICSFGTGGFNRLQKNIPYLSMGEADYTLTSANLFGNRTMREDVSVPRQTTYHVFESTPRLLALRAVLSDRFT
jgi:nucleoside 2-deoxyribosyltransferase